MLSFDTVTRYTSRIDDLNLRNRTLEHTVEKVKNDLASEKSRGETAMREIKSRWEKERLEWREGCDSLQAVHRVAHLRVAVELEKERRALLVEREASRKERLGRLQRDNRLLMFQIEEFKKEARVTQLESKLAETKKLHRSQLDEARKKLEAQQNRCRELDSQLEEKIEELEGVVEGRAQLEKSLSGLRAEHTTLIASSSSGSTELERSKLRLEGLQATHAELEGKYADLQRANTDLRRQLEKWSNLEIRDDGERDTLRKRKVELEVEVATLQTRLEDADKVAQQKEDKLKARIERYREKIVEHEGVVNEAKEMKEIAEKRGSALQKCQQQLADAEGRIKDLTSKLESAGAKTQSDSAKGKNVPIAHIRSEESEVEVEEVAVNSPPKPRPKPRPLVKARNPPPSTRGDDDDDDVEFVAMSPSKGKARETSEVGAHATKKSKKAQESIADRDPPQPSQKGKGKSKPGMDATPADEIDDVDSSQRVKKRGRPKGNAEGTAQESGTKSKKSKPPSQGKSTTRQTSVTATGADSEEERDSVPKKKKRKINLFPSAQPTSFNWGDLSQGGAGDLNIPTNLSPVKDSDAVPPRSTSRVGSTLSWAHGGRR